MRSEKGFLTTFLKNCVVYAFGSIFLAIPWIFWSSLEASTPIYALAILGVFLAIVSYGTYEELTGDMKRGFNSQLV